LKKPLKTLLVLMIFAFAMGAQAEPVVYIDEPAFLDALAGLGYTPVHEGFEDDATWGDVRGLAPAVSSQGLTWTSNNLISNITTGEGAAITGQYGFYSIPHGSYGNPDPGTDCLIPGDCGDGFRGRGVDALLYAIGGWVDTNTPFAKLGLFLGEYPDNPMDFGETCDPPDSENCFSNSTIGTTPKFFGVIDELGFERFEYRELEGKLEIDGGDRKNIFADDFYFAIGEPNRLFRDGFESQ
jgi:hypothetical protein